MLHCQQLPFGDSYVHEIGELFPPLHDHIPELLSGLSRIDVLCDEVIGLGRISALVDMRVHDTNSSIQSVAVAYDPKDSASCVAPTSTP